MGDGPISHVPCGRQVSVGNSVFGVIPGSTLRFVVFLCLLVDCQSDCSDLLITETCLVDVKRMEPVDGISAINKVKQILNLMGEKCIDDVPLRCGVNSLSLTIV